MYKILIFEETDTIMRKAFFILCTAVVFAACSGNGVKSTRLERNQNSGINTETFGNVFWDVSLSGMTSKINSLMVLKDGKVIYEGYDPAHSATCLHVMWSASKTFTATAVGFAVQDGLMKVDDLVADYFEPEMLGEDPDGYFKKLTVKDLLIMSSGLKKDFLSDSDERWNDHATEMALKGGWAFEPGTKFHYNSINTYLTGVIVSKVTGKRLSDYLNEKLFTPLGIREYEWEQSGEGYDYGGWGLFLSVENFAKMGQFFLQKGVWEGKRLLPESWFDEAMAAQIIQRPDDFVPEQDEWNQGYGYQMWRCTHGACRLDGAYGQFCIIIPEKNAVVAIHEHSRNTAASLNAVWKEIYPYL